jgi:hypothetical protein
VYKLHLEKSPGGVAKREEVKASIVSQLKRVMGQLKKGSNQNNISQFFEDYKPGVAGVYLVQQPVQSWVVQCGLRTAEPAVQVFQHGVRVQVLVLESVRKPALHHLAAAEKQLWKRVVNPRGLTRVCD